jgi:hypothetical protein
MVGNAMTLKLTDLLEPQSAPGQIGFDVSIKLSIAISLKRIADAMPPAKVYVVVPSHSHDGWGAPASAHRTSEEADCAAAADKSIFGAEVFELEVGA